jgi:hypothetical protein
VGVLSENGRPGVFPGGTKSLIGSETGRSVMYFFGRTELIIDSSIIRTKEQGVNRVGQSGPRR